MEITTQQAMTLLDFCKSYAVSRSFAYLEIKANRLIVKKAGRRVLILKRDADAWANGLPSSNRNSEISVEA